MKKSAVVLGVVIVLSAAYVGSSWYVGKRAQATIGQAIGQANQRLAKVLGPGLAGSGLKLAISDYKRHVFSSDVVYTVQMKDASGQPVEYLLSDHLQHGPFPVQALRAGDLKPMLALSNARLIPSAVTKKWFDSLNGDSPVVAVTRVGFSGSGQSTWQFKPVNLVEAGDSLKFSGGDVDVTFAGNFQDSTVAGRFESLAFASADTGENLEITGIRLNNQTTTPTENNIQVQSTASADSLLFSSGNSGAVLLEKMAIGLDTLQKDKLIDGVLHYNFGRIVVGQADLGSMSVRAKGSNFDVAAVTALAAEYDTVKARRDKNPDQDFTLTDAESLLLREKLFGVLATYPTLAIDPVLWKNDQGQASLALTLNLSPVNKNSAPSHEIDVLLPQILKLLNLDVSVSKPMFIKAFSQVQGGADANHQAAMIGALIFDQYAARLAQAGLVKVEGDKAFTAIKYQNNSIDVNGHKMSVPEFAQRALGVAM